jgi:hypothetical protein
MAMVRNGLSLGLNPGFYHGAIGFNSTVWNYGKNGSRMRMFDHGQYKSGIPSGAEPPVSFVLPLKAGGLAAFNTISGEFVFNQDLQAVKEMLATLGLSFSLDTSNASLIVDMATSLTALFDLSPTLEAVAQLSIELAMAGDIPASLGLIVSMVCALDSSYSLGSSNLKGEAAMEVLLTTATEAVTVDAIYDAIFDTENTAGNHTLREVLRLIRAHLAGKSSGLTGGSGSYVVRNPEDNKTVVTATIDTNGNRTAITTDLS